MGRCRGRQYDTAARQQAERHQTSGRNSHSHFVCECPTSARRAASKTIISDRPAARRCVKYFRPVRKTMSAQPSTNGETVVLEELRVSLGRFAAEDSYDVIDRYDEELIALIQIDRNGILGMKQNLVVITERHVFVMLDHSADRYDPTGNGGDLRRVGEGDSSTRLAFRFIFENQHARTDRFDVLQIFGLLGHVALDQDA